MEYTNLKGTGLKVSRFCLGTMTFGDQTDEAEARRIIDCALEQGVNFFDTADGYTGGLSEQILGRALEGRRENAVIATKVTNPTGPGPNNAGQGRKHILQNVERSLSALRTDYIDLYYLHRPDPDTPAEEVVETMTGLVRSGKIRYWGVSNYPAWQFCSLVHTARELRGVGPVATESVYNLITRGIEDELAPFLTAYRLGLTVFNPIAAGLLTGKHSRGHLAEHSRLRDNYGYNLRYISDQNMDAVERLTAAAADSGLTLLELALQWLLNRPVVDSVIVGASKLSHVEQNIALAAEKKPLPPEVLAACDAVWDDIRGHFFSYHANARPPKKPENWK